MKLLTAIMSYLVMNIDPKHSLAGPSLSRAHHPLLTTRLRLLQRLVNRDYYHLLCHSLIDYFHYSYIDLDY